MPAHRGAPGDGGVDDGPDVLAGFEPVLEKRTGAARDELRALDGEKDVVFVRALHQRIDVHVVTRHNSDGGRVERDRATTPAWTDERRKSS